MIRPIAIGCMVWLLAAHALAAEPLRPNVVIVFCDDLGYGDIGPFGAQIVERLLAIAERARADLGDSLTKRTGDGVRPSGRLGESGTHKPNPVSP